MGNIRVCNHCFEVIWDDDGRAIEVTRPNEKHLTLHFCDWGCVYQYAGTAMVNDGWEDMRESNWMNEWHRALKIQIEEELDAAGRLLEDAHEH